MPFVWETRLTQIPPTQILQRPLATKPHRGGTILTLGIVGLVLTFGCGLGWIMGIIAWVMANTDLREMDAGRMDPSGRSNTHAGRVCGIISVGLAIVSVVLTILWFAFFAAIIGAAAAGAGSGPTP